MAFCRNGKFVGGVREATHMPARARAHVRGRARRNRSRRALRKRPTLTGQRYSIPAARFSVPSVFCHRRQRTSSTDAMVGGQQTAIDLDGMGSCGVFFATRRRIVSRVNPLKCVNRPKNVPFTAMRRKT